MNVMSSNIPYKIDHKELGSGKKKEKDLEGLDTL
jgi:hypothetical protein